MKNTGKCPKCQSVEIRRIFPSGDERSSGGIGIGLFSYVIPVNFLCCACGYMEQWIDDPRDLEKIRKKH